MIELIILGMLYDGTSLTGYDVKKMMEHSTHFFHSSSLGSIQPALKKLEQKGLIRSNEEIENNRLKKYFTITDGGSKYFDEKIREDFGSDKLKCNQLVKVFFFDSLSYEEQQDSLDAYLEETFKILNTLKGLEALAIKNMAALGITHENTPATSYHMDTLRFGIDYYSFVAGWFTNYKVTLSQRHSNRIKEE